MRLFCGTHFGGDNLDFLTVKEVAELKGCSERYIQNCISKGKIEAKAELNSKGKTKFLVPVSVLPDELKGKYYGSIRSKEEAPPELKDVSVKKPKKQPKNTVKRSFEEYSLEERSEITKWCGILEEWQTVCI